MKARILQLESSLDNEKADKARVTSLYETEKLKATELGQQLHSQGDDFSRVQTEAQSLSKMRQDLKDEVAQLTKEQSTLKELLNEKEVTIQRYRDDLTHASNEERRLNSLLDQNNAQIADVSSCCFVFPHAFLDDHLFLFFVFFFFAIAAQVARHQQRGQDSTTGSGDCDSATRCAAVASRVERHQEAVGEHNDRSGESCVILLLSRICCCCY